MQLEGAAVEIVCGSIAELPFADASLDPVCTRTE
jgi:hypothetical protein